MPVRPEQVKMNPVLEAMRRAMAGKEPARNGGKALEAARSLFDREPREFLRLLGKLEAMHERKRQLKLERIERKRREEREAAQEKQRGYAEPPPEVASEAPPAEAGPLPDLIARLLGG